jgi:hypothetical protein
LSKILSVDLVVLGWIFAAF